MTISPGWYPDPADRSTQRYWDGGGWVGASLPVGVTPPDGPPAEQVAPAAPPPPGRYGPGYPPGSTGGPGSTGSRPPWMGPGAPGMPPGAPGTPGWPAAAQLPPIRPHGLPLATPGARMVARLVDIGAVLLLNIVVNGYFVYLWVQQLIPYFRAVVKAQQETGDLMPTVDPPEQYGWLILVISFLALALWFAYEVPATASTGQTLGKRLARIKVVRAENLEPLGFGRAWQRWNPLALPLLLLSCCGPFLVLPMMLDVVPILFDRVQRMAMHDRAARTFVVQLPKHTPDSRSRAEKRGS